MIPILLHLGGVAKCVRLIWEWSDHHQESGDLQKGHRECKKKGAYEPSKLLQDELKAALKEALLEKKAAEEAQAASAEGFFSLYANLLSEDT